jgi:hypothetical protein
MGDWKNKWKKKKKERDFFFFFIQFFSNHASVKRKENKLFEADTGFKRVTFNNFK